MHYYYSSLLPVAYYSNNDEVASVDETGLVSFLKAGTAIITVTNTKVNSVYDTITFNVSNIEVSAMTSTINATLKEGIYNLEIYKTYVISNIIEPSNATDKTVTYSYSSDEYFELVDAPLLVVGVHRMLSYAPTSLNASKLFRRSYLSLVSLGAPSAKYYSVPLLYQSLCDYYKCQAKKVKCCA